MRFPSTTSEIRLKPPVQSMRPEASYKQASGPGTLQQSQPNVSDLTMEEAHSGPKHESHARHQQVSASHHQKQIEQEKRLQERLRHIRYRLVVLSGKGGVGKSTVAVNLAVALTLAGWKVGLLDADIHGPSIPTMLGLEGSTGHVEGGELHPVESHGLRVLSLGFLLRSQHDAVIWRGPLKAGILRQFLSDVAWGDLDFLVVDSPPGTGDEPLSICQLLGKVDGAIIVTTPQKIAGIDVRKCVTFCRQLGVPVLGVIENMSGFVCSHCGKVTPIFQTGGGLRIATDMNIPFLGSIPIDPKIVEACDNGEVFIIKDAASPTAKTIREIIDKIVARVAGTHQAGSQSPANVKEASMMRIAIPLAQGQLSPHFGHCENFALVDVDAESKSIVKRENIEAPPHQPGLLPPWLSERNVDIIIAGGMGRRALGLFAEHGIQVVIGAKRGTPEDIVKNYLEGNLELGQNVCDH